MNQVHVKFFAIFREYIGLKEDWRDIEPGMTVQQLWDSYVARAKNPRVANFRAAFSVNQRLAKPETVLNGGEEVGFLPPVSGGASPTKRPSKRKALVRKTAGSSRKALRTVRTPNKDTSLLRDFVVTADPLALDALVARVSHPGAGGITTFIGIVRDNAHGKSVKSLEYEAYPELAERMLEQLGAEAQERWSDVRLAIAHRTGPLQIGDASVIIAASAPHRAEAFAACRYAIERLKVVLPVWKKEFASDTDYWVEGPTPGEVSPDQATQVVASAEQAAHQGPASMPAREFSALGTNEGGEIRADLESV
jgi:molybdopterin synthase catalytic subunit/molybdopterin converting factor small subunit